MIGNLKVHAVNLIEIRLGNRWQPISDQCSVTGGPTTNNKEDCLWKVPKSRLFLHVGFETSQLQSGEVRVGHLSSA